MSIIDELSPTLRLRYADLGGVRTRYYDSGSEGVEDALPLILIHGTGGAADHYVRNLAGIGKHRRVLVPDLLGHGYTGTPEGYENTMSQDLEVDHILRFADHCGLDHFAIGGASFGALCAALTYLRRPDKVDRLILIGSATVFHNEEERMKAVADGEKNGTEAFAAPTPVTIRRRHKGVTYRQEDQFEETFLLRLTFMSQPGRVEVFEWLHKSARATASDPDRQVYHRLEALDVPTVVIIGKNDPRCDYKAVEKLMPRFPNATLALVDESGHQPMAEHREEFNGIVNDFLEGL